MLLAFFKLPFVIRIFVLCSFGWSLSHGLLYVNYDMVVVLFISSGCSKMLRHRSQQNRLCTYCLFQE